MDCKPVNPKRINPEYSLEGLMLKLKYFGHLLQRADSLEKTLMLGKIEGRRATVDEVTKSQTQLSTHVYICNNIGTVLYGILSYIFLVIISQSCLTLRPH